MILDIEIMAPIIFIPTESEHSATTVINLGKIVVKSQPNPNN